MKTIIAIFASLAILTNAFAVFAVELPANYQTRGELDGPYACDRGKTTAKQYINEDEDWGVLEVYTESGDTFIHSNVGGKETFVIKNASGIKDMSHPEWDDALFKAAPMVFHILHETSPSDCVPTPAQTN